MNDDEFKEIRWHVIVLFIAAVVIALDVFVWRA
jgi:hypothetical protein